MPLPPALLERLKRRKIIQITEQTPQEESSSTKSSINDEKEESSQFNVISGKGSESIDHDRSEIDISKHDSYRISGYVVGASGSKQCDSDEGGTSYDEKEDRKITDQSSSVADEESEQAQRDHSRDADGDKSIVAIGDGKQDYQSVIGCPNKYNIYHVCGEYCVDNYGQLDADSMVPTKKQRQELALMLKTYPMSNDWTVVYDPGVRTFYFWNIISGHVSWGPPGLSSFASPSADQIRKAYMESELYNQQHIDSTEQQASDGTVFFQP